MTKRREFLKWSGLAAGSLIFQQQAASAFPVPDASFRDKSGNINWKKVRKQFRLDKGKIFLNNGTMGPSPDSVMEAVWKSMQAVNTNASYGGWDMAIEPLARYFNASPEEICLTHNVTDGINIIAQGLPLKEGDEVIVSNQEHAGNALPWLARAERDKLKIKVLDLTLPDEEMLSMLHSLIGPNTRVIALPHIPCTNGRIIPANQIGTIAREKGLFYFLDGAHGAGMINLDFAELNCDYYATCTHKWMLGPKGTGFLFIRKGSMEHLTPIFAGAYSDTGWTLTDGNPRILGWNTKANRHTNGTQNRSIYAGVKAAVEFHESIGKSAISARIRELNTYLFSKLKEIEGITLITPEEQRAGICAFTFKEKDYVKFQHFCMKRHIIIRIVPENEVHAVRVSTHIYNQPEEIDTFVQTLNDFLHA